jgi:thiol-disulfide isomerase/thioredoxin
MDAVFIPLSNAFFEHGTWLVPTVALALVLAVLWVGRQSPLFLPRRGWQIALDVGLLAALGLWVSAAYVASRVQRAIEARVASLDLHRVSDGSACRVAGYEGKVVVLNFWATWCPSCREEMPDLNRLAKAHRADGVVVLTVTDEPVEEIRRYEAETVPLLTELATFQDERPPEGGLDAFAYQGRPATLVIDRGGVVRQLMIGAQPYEVFERALRARL